MVGVSGASPTDLPINVPTENPGAFISTLIVRCKDAASFGLKLVG
jgi:hypothetical protein